MHQNKDYLSFQKYFRSIDPQIVLALVVLFCFSMMLVATSGMAVASRIGLDEHYFIIRQAVYLVGAAVLIVDCII